MIAFALTLLVVLAFVVGLLLGYAVGLRRIAARRTRGRSIGPEIP
jgi:uncharacterized integral membrane protein